MTMTAFPENDGDQRLATKGLSTPPDFIASPLHRLVLPDSTRLLPSAAESIGSAAKEKRICVSHKKPKNANSHQAGRDAACECQLGDRCLLIIPISAIERGYAKDNVVEYQ